MKYTVNRALEMVQSALDNAVEAGTDISVGSLSDLAECMATIRAELDVPPSYDDAWNVINQDYWNDVRRIDDEIRRMAKDGEIDKDGLYDAIHEKCDNSQRVIYTRRARVGLCCTNNPDAYEEEIGDKPPTVEAAMCMALIADVTAQLDDIEWPGDESDDE